MRSRFIAVLAVLVIAAMPVADAFAKAGKGSSLGSRGERTHDRPIERSYTPPPAAAPAPAPGVGAQPMYNPGAVKPQAQPGMAAAPMAQPMAQPGFFQRNPFVTGMLGGLVGAGIGSMLFGHSPALAAASDAAPMASMLGTLLQLALIGGLVYLVVRLFRSRDAANAGAVNQRGGGDYALPSSAPVSVPSSAARVEKEFEPSEADKAAFATILAGVQKAWSDGNPHALRQYATPEVLGWMNDDLTKDQSQGLRNVVEDVVLLKGEVSESWSEGKTDYATAVMTFSAKDYTIRLQDGQVVEGNSSRAVEHTEAWTFVRVNGGQWLLTAIEQV